MAALTADQARRFYDRLGAIQDLQAFYEDPATDDLIRHADFEHATRVVEFGCGTGRLARRLFTAHLPDDARYLGVDLSPTMVRLATDRLKRWDDRAEIRQSDGSMHLAVRSGGFDRFIAVYVLDLLGLDDIDALLREAHRVLSPGGRLCLASLAHGHSPLERLVSWCWERLYRVCPIALGGCRPIRTERLLRPSQWTIIHSRQLGSFGISSQVVIAVPVPGETG